MPNIKDINSADIKCINDKKESAIVVFWAPWCGPYTILSKTLTELILDEDRINIYKINTDSHPEVIKEYGVKSIPLLMFLKDGKEVDRKSGAVAKSQITETLSKEY
jgi:thioredoxin 1